jgi:hypothetical protein
MQVTEQDQQAAYEVGAIWNTSWGYDQTNVEFFQVVRTTPASVVLRRIACEHRGGREYPVPDAFRTDFGLMGNQGTPAYERDVARGYSEKMCRRSRSTYHTSVRIDDVRTAWPYAGQGTYSTQAAGLPGH